MAALAIRQNNMQKTFVYIDGFNLYYRGIKNTPYKWLDLKLLCQKVLDPTHKIESIKYFTALVSGRGDPQKPIRQQTYIRALKKYIPEISIYYGHFLSNCVLAPLANPVSNQKYVKIIKTEEKGSDVNLATHLLNDAWLNRYDCAVIISNDSDLIEAINLVKQQHKRKIGLILPPDCYPSKTLMKKVNFIKKLRRNTIISSQLPNPIPGTNIHKPLTW
jgi:uncharacterized LabA/DUF88 family protein